MRSIILINMKKNGILIKINNEEVPQEKVIEALERKMPILKKLYKETKSPIIVTGKILKDKEMEEVKETIKKEIDATISFETANELGLHGIKKVYEQNVENSDTYFHKGGLRSGQRLEKEGSIVIIGDVNSGAEVIAGDNIVVLGALRGLAHAGAKGNMKAIIASSKIECPQLRIANVLKEMEKEEIEETKQFASIVEDKIVLE